jgi:hypothetical protein
LFLKNSYLPKGNWQNIKKDPSQTKTGQQLINPEKNLKSMLKQTKQTKIK